MESVEQLTFSALSIVQEYEELESAADEVDGVRGDAALMAAVAGEKEEKKEVVDPAAAVYAIPELASLGRVFRSSAPTELSEEETEYVVRCIKHVMPEHIILQFLIQNTVEEQRLVNCTVAIEGDSECFEVAGEIAAESIKYGETVNAFAVVTRNPDVPLAPCNFVWSWLLLRLDLVLVGRHVRKLVHCALQHAHSHGRTIARLVILVIQAAFQ